MDPNALDVGGFDQAATPAKVLITVKTYPVPSLTHVETVCVAGVRLDTVFPEWVRLYPIPFRTEAFDYEFAKYQIIDVPIVPRGTRDPRPESYSPQNDRIQLGDKIDTRRNWSKRRDLIGHLIGERTTCELIEINRKTPMNEGAPSLALVKPRDAVVTVQPGKGWSSKQQIKVDRAATPTLFDGPAVRTALQPMPHQLKVAYMCMTDSCRGHNQTILDWEVGAAAYHWSKDYPAEAIPHMLQKKWAGMMAPDKDTHFYIGNQHQYRHSFSILGVWYPKR